MDQLRFAEIVEDRIKNLEEANNYLTQLTLKNIDHKRAFLGNLMTISAAITAALFFILTTDFKSSLPNFYSLLISVSAFFSVLFITANAAYMVTLLSQESMNLDKRLAFGRKSKEDFISKLNRYTINNIDEYNHYVQEQYLEENKLVDSKLIDGEKYFLCTIALFIISYIPLLFILYHVLCMNS